MSRIIAVTVCGFMLAACSTTMPSLDFMKSAPQTESLTIVVVSFLAAVDGDID